MYKKIVKKPKGVWRPILLSMLMSGWAASIQASVPGAPGIVGEVSMVIGKAWIQHPGAARERVRQGAAIRVSDAIETSTGGTVHVRFVDGALVSVRPASTLEVQLYRYDPLHPEQSAVKFNLLEGVARAISGEAAHHARDNFRLNTPIAAIGVRGTDFVVSADQDSVRALVTEGTIVVSRFSESCLASALGPCSSDGLELAGGGRQIMQLSANTREPVLLPIAAGGLPQRGAAEAANSGEVQSERQGDRENAGAGDLADTVTTRTVNQTIAVTRATAAPPAPPQPDPPAPEYTPAVALAESALTASGQLVWGRYVSPTNERISVQYKPLEEPFVSRNITVANNHYGLFRVENGSNEMQPGLGAVNFSLNSAQAQYYNTSGAGSLMEVKGGSLRIDFAESTFATSLNLNHAATGAINIVDSGRVFAGGYFHSRSDTQIVAGAVSLDGKEAGYFFEKVLGSGSIEGLTLWGRQP
jgi:hypothetical protein